jgi:hypothetical protein
VGAPQRDHPRRHPRRHALRLRVPRVRAIGERSRPALAKPLQPFLSRLFTDPKLRTELDDALVVLQTGTNKRGAFGHT